MTDRDALYRAIVARPEDDTPRLVYADWLEENGREEEAEFVRLECRLEASPPDQPEYMDLVERQEELRLWLSTHSPGPQLKLGSGLDVAGGRNWWQCTSRGFPRFLNWEHVGGRDRPGVRGMRRLAAAMEKAFAILPTRWLVIDHITVEELAELLKQPVIAALDCLTISTDEEAGDESARIIANCQQLRNLRVAMLFPFGDAGAEALGGSQHLGRLEWLELDSGNLSPLAICALGAGGWFRNLRNLWLRESLFADAFEELCRLPPFPNLHTLNLSRNSFPVSSWQQFARSKTFPQLTQLELNGADMSDGRMAALAHASGFRLTSLDLSYTAIGNEGARALVAVPWVGSLQNLDLTSNLLGPTAITAIAGCRKLTQLKRLNLEDNLIGRTGFKAIARSPTLRNLSTLSLGDCSARNGALLPAQFQEFLEKINLPNLRHLNLSNMAIGAKAARLLTDEKFRNLTRLLLTKCKLTDAAISAMLSSPTLQNLIELRLDSNSLKTGTALLTNRRVLPKLSMCTLTGNPIDPNLCRKLARRPGVIVPTRTRSSR